MIKGVANADSSGRELGLGRDAWETGWSWPWWANLLPTCGLTGERSMSWLGSRQGHYEELLARIDRLNASGRRPTGEGCPAGTGLTSTARPPEFYLITRIRGMSVSPAFDWSPSAMAPKIRADGRRREPL